MKSSSTLSILRTVARFAATACLTLPVTNLLIAAVPCPDRFKPTPPKLALTLPVLPGAVPASRLDAPQTKIIEIPPPLACKAHPNRAFQVELNPVATVSAPYFFEASDRRGTRVPTEISNRESSLELERKARDSCLS